MVLTLFALMTFGAVQAQAGERVKTLKVAFITERLSLTSKEAQTFWPIYNEHEQKMEAIRRKERTKLRQRAGDWANLSESEASKLLNDFQDLQQKKHDAEKQLVRDLRDVLPAKKIILLLKAEEDFKKRLLQQIRKRRGNR